MSVTKLGLILFSGFLIFATAPLASAQQNSTDQNTTTSTTQKQTQKKTTAWKEHESKANMSHENVREMQAALKKDGFDPGPVDGVMGPMTMSAIRNYQMSNHLQVTGTLNAETRNLLMSGASAQTSSIENKNENNESRTYSSKQQSQNETQPLAKPSVGTTAGESAVSNPGDVKEAQQDLSDLGYNPGDINGMMSSDTQEAIRQFQWFNNMPATGVLDEQTKSALDMQEQGGAQNNAQLSQNNPLPDQEREKPSVATSNDQSASQATTQSSNNEETYNSKTSKHHGAKYDREASERATKAANVLQDLTKASDSRIPNEILQRAEAVAVIPHMIKGAFGVGGDYGKGLVSERTESGQWSAPAFLTIGGGSFGAQIGVEGTDLVLVFTNRDAMNLLEKGTDVKLGADASVAAGPIGRSATAGVNGGLSGVLAYSRAKGLFAGVALDGAVLKMEKHMNQRVYGPSVDAKEILNGQVAANSYVQPFIVELNQLVPMKRISQR